MANDGWLIQNDYSLINLFMMHNLINFIQFPFLADVAPAPHFISLSSSN